jgi:hypothetical protein
VSLTREARAERSDALYSVASDMARLVAPRYAFCSVRTESQGVDLVGIWEWPGVVRVRHRNTHALLVQSRPGEPEALDSSANVGALPAAFTPTVQAAALRKAAFGLKHSDYPPRIRKAVLGGALIEVTAEWIWPGILRVTDRKTGKRIVESVAGYPEAPDFDWLETDR